MADYLFHKYSFSSYLSGRKETIRDTVNKIPKEKFASSTEEELFEHVYSEFKVGVVLELHEELASLTEKQFQFDLREHYERSRWLRSHDEAVYVPATKFTLTIPFVGDSDFFQCQPDRFYLSGGPRGEIKKQTLVLDYTILDDEVKNETDTAQRIQTSFEKSKSDINEAVGHLNRMASVYDGEIVPIIKDNISKRREEVSKLGSVLKLINIPLAAKPGVEVVNQLPVKKRKVVPLPIKTTDIKEPIYGINDQDYSQILNVIRFSGGSFERTPETFNKLQEEELRNVILSNLNSSFEGNATGETFNKKGKTDIFISAEKKAAFVAECKNWAGESVFHKTIDQLLGYLTWRDCKTSIVIFNKKNKDFSSVRLKMAECIKTHPNYVRDLPSNIEGEWSAIFKSKEDDGQHIRIHFFGFNIYI